MAVVVYNVFLTFVVSEAAFGRFVPPFRIRFPVPVQSAVLVEDVAVLSGQRTPGGGSTICRVHNPGTVSAETVSAETVFVFVKTGGLEIRINVRFPVGIVVAVGLIVLVIVWVRTANPAWVKTCC